MNRIIFAAAALIGLMIVANSAPKKPVKKVPSKPAPCYAVQVRDEAEEIRKMSERANKQKNPTYF